MPENPSNEDDHSLVKGKGKMTGDDGTDGLAWLKISEQQQFSKEKFFKIQGLILLKSSTAPEEFTEKKQEKRKEQSKVKDPEKAEQKSKQPKEKEEPKLPNEVSTSTASTTYGYCGLVNLGLSCYANSCLQVLFNLLPIRQYLLTNAERGPFHKSLAELFAAMQTQSTSPEVPNQTSVSFKPDKFMGQFRSVRPDFAMHRMADAQEFITILLDLLHQETNDADKRKSSEREQAVDHQTSEEAWAYHEQYIDHSFWSSQLMGQVESTLTCLTCAHKSLSWSCIWQLQLPLVASQVMTQQQQAQLFKFNSLEPLGENKSPPISNSSAIADSSTPMVTLSDCLKAFLAEETLSSDCAPYCSQCSQRRPATKSVTICRAPKVLLVHLTRFLPNGSKNPQPVNIDEHIELPSKSSYKLVSAVLHHGSINYGHYITLFNQQQQQWIILDDEVFDKKTSKSTATEMLCKYAYMVIYQLDEP